jgi:hypothetical protein
VDAVRVVQPLGPGPTIFSTQAVACPKCGLATIQWGDDFSCLTCSAAPATGNTSKEGSQVMGRVKQALHLLAVIIVGGAVSVYAPDHWDAD